MLADYDAAVRTWAKRQATTTSLWRNHAWKINGVEIDAWAVDLGWAWLAVAYLRDRYIRVIGSGPHPQRACFEDYQPADYSLDFSKPFWIGELSNEPNLRVDKLLQPRRAKTAAPKLIRLLRSPESDHN
jgi:hypothetical protein